MTATHTAICNCGPSGSSRTVNREDWPMPLHNLPQGSGAPFTANAIWTADSVTVEGKTANWKATTVAPAFLPALRVGVFGVSDGTDGDCNPAGVFDAAPTDLEPTLRSCG